jgi:hypothetical protein
VRDFRNGFVLILLLWIFEGIAPPPVMGSSHNHSQSSYGPPVAHAVHGSAAPSVHPLPRTYIYDRQWRENQRLLKLRSALSPDFLDQSTSGSNAPEFGSNGMDGGPGNIALGKLSKHGSTGNGG